MAREPSTNAKWIVAAVIALAVAAFFALGGYTWVRGEGNVEELLTETGFVGPLVFVLVMWLVQPLGVPGFVFMAPAGIVWPTPIAIALAWIGNMGASYIAFSFARWYGRDWVGQRIPSRMRLYYDRLETGGVWPVVVLRLVFGQLPPADWLLGVTKVPMRNFWIGTGVGILPGIVLIVVAGGGVLEALADMSTTTRRIVIGLLVAIWITIRVVRRRRRATLEA